MNGLKIVMESADAILKPIETLKQLLLSVVSLAGIFVVVKAIMELSDGIQAKDTSAIRQSVLQLAGGLMLALIGVTLTILGISS